LDVKNQTKGNQKERNGIMAFSHDFRRKPTRKDTGAALRVNTEVPRETLEQH
jgi:hypothetical protein